MRETEGLGFDKALAEERLRITAALVSPLAHELNNALFPISSQTELLLSGPRKITDSEKVNRALKTIGLACRQITEIIEQLHALHRRCREHDQFKLHDLQNLIRKSIAEFDSRLKQSSVDAKIRIEFRRLEKSVTLQGDERELGIAFLNIFANAAEAMPQGGEIRVKMLLKDPWIRIRVSDTGTGMPPEVLAHCFEPYFTTTKSQLRGLGLSIARDIVKRHGGEIEVQSNPGKGSQLTLSFPLP